MSVPGALESPQSAQMRGWLCSPRIIDEMSETGVLPAPVPVPLRRLREKARHAREMETQTGQLSPGGGWT